jgi:hypothetical protein
MALLGERGRKMTNKLVVRRWIAGLALVLGFLLVPCVDAQVSRLKANEQAAETGAHEVMLVKIHNGRGFVDLDTGEFAEEIPQLEERPATAGGRLGLAGKGSRTDSDDVLHDVFTQTFLPPPGLVTAGFG